MEEKTATVDFLTSKTAFLFLKKPWRAVSFQRNIPFCEALEVAPMTKGHGLGSYHTSSGSSKTTTKKDRFFEWLGSGFWKGHGFFCWPKNVCWNNDIHRLKGTNYFKLPYFQVVSLDWFQSTPISLGCDEADLCACIAGSFGKCRWRKSTTAWCFTRCSWTGDWRQGTESLMKAMMI